MLPVAYLFFFVLLGSVSNRNANYFIFPTVLQIEKTCVVFKILDQRADYPESDGVKDLI